MLKRVLIILAFFGGSFSVSAQEEPHSQIARTTTATVLSWPDMLLEIFQCLNPKEVLPLSRVCKEWYKAVNLAFERKFNPSLYIRTNRFDDSLYLFNHKLLDSTKPIPQKTLLEVFLDNRRLTHKTLYTIATSGIPALQELHTWVEKCQKTDKLQHMYKILTDHTARTEDLEGFKKLVNHYKDHLHSLFRELEIYVTQDIPYIPFYRCELSQNLMRISKLSTNMNITAFERMRGFVIRLIQRTDWGKLSNQGQRDPEILPKLKTKADRWKLFTLLTDYECTPVLDFGYRDTYRFAPFTELPEPLYHLPNTIDVTLSNHHLTHIPKQIDWPWVTTINLSGNRFTKFPREILQCQDLIELDISGNELTTLPEDFKLFKNLRVLNCDNNHFPEFPAVLKSMESLCRLHISGNKIKTIPALSLPVLVDLDLSGNQVEAWPDLSHCSRLEKINLAKNTPVGNQGQIQQINSASQGSAAETPLSKTINQAKFPASLQELNISENGLDKMPNLKNCPRLYELDITKNNFERPPDYLFELPSLKKINGIGNPFKGLPNTATGTIYPDKPGWFGPDKTLNIDVNDRLRLEYNQKPVLNIQYHTFSLDTYMNIAKGICLSVAGAAGLYYTYKMYKSYRAKRALQQSELDAKELSKKTSSEGKSQRKEKALAELEELLQQIS